MTVDTTLSYPVRHRPTTPRETKEASDFIRSIYQQKAVSSMFSVGVYDTYVIVRMFCRTNRLILHLGCTIGWCGLPWIRTTTDGGRWLATELVALGPIGIKVGQYLSQRPDLFSVVSCRELSGLTDRNTQVSWSDLRARAPVDGMTQVETPALGTGALAQVHRMRWRQEIVVVKVMLPVDTVVRVELGVCRFVLDLFYRSGVLPIRWDTFIDELECQLDMRYEAEELRYAYKLFGGHTGLLLPNKTRVRVPYLHSSSKQCLMLEEARGKSLHQFSATDPAGRRAFTARFQALQHMIASGDRRFHADLHDGNVLYDEVRDILWLIDFGLCVHPPVEWIPPMVLFDGDPAIQSDDGNGLEQMLSTLFSIDTDQARSLVPVFRAMVIDTADQGRSIQDSVRAFFAFTHHVQHRIQSHTMAYILQLIVVGTHEIRPDAYDTDDPIGIEALPKATRIRCPVEGDPTDAFSRTRRIDALLTTALEGSEESLTLG